MSEENMAIAETILAQMGGQRRLTMMTGAKNYVAVDRGLQFKLPRGSAKDGINHVKITLDPSDTYIVECLAVNYKTQDFEVKASEEGVYCDQLMDCFERCTGLYLTFSPRR